MTLPGTLTNPPLAVGLAGLLDWSTAQPLLDHFKLARPWTGTVGGRFGALSFDDLRAQGVIDPQGWPLAVPEGVEAVSTVLLTELHAGAQDLAGRYLLTWRGEGEIALKGATAQAPQDGGIAFDFRPDPQRALGLDITRITRGPIRDIRVVQLDNLSRHRDGQLFRREWLDRVRNYRLLRFMDWMFTNNSVQAEWADRPRPEDAFYTWRGAPVGVGRAGHASSELSGTVSPVASRTPAVETEDVFRFRPTMWACPPSRRCPVGSPRGSPGRCAGTPSATGCGSSTPPGRSTPPPAWTPASTRSPGSPG